MAPPEANAQLQDMPQTRDEAAMSAALLRSAMALVQDPAEAQALVDQMLASAGPSSRLSEMQLFRLLRQTYHSIERSRRRRPMRDALVTSLARDYKPVPAEQDS